MELGFTSGNYAYQCVREASRESVGNSQQRIHDWLDGLMRSFLALHERGIDRAAELFDRLRPDQQLVADYESRRRRRASGLSAIVIGPLRVLDRKIANR